MSTKKKKQKEHRKEARALRQLRKMAHEQVIAEIKNAPFVVDTGAFTEVAVFTNNSAVIASGDIEIQTYEFKKNN